MLANGLLLLNESILFHTRRDTSSLNESANTSTAIRKPNCRTFSNLLKVNGVAEVGGVSTVVCVNKTFSGSCLHGRSEGYLYFLWDFERDPANTQSHQIMHQFVDYWNWRQLSLYGMNRWRVRIAWMTIYWNDFANCCSVAVSQSNCPIINRNECIFDSNLCFMRQRKRSSNWSHRQRFQPHDIHYSAKWCVVCGFVVCQEQANYVSVLFISQSDRNAKRMIIIRYSDIDFLFVVRLLQMKRGELGGCLIFECPLVCSTLQTTY